jgi:hypothetical protein
MSVGVNVHTYTHMCKGIQWHFQDHTPCSTKWQSNWWMMIWKGSQKKEVYDIIMILSQNLPEMDWGKQHKSRSPTILLHDHKPLLIFTGPCIVIQCVPLTTEPVISLMIPTPMKILQRNWKRGTFVVWEMKRNVPVVCVCSAPNCCNKEQRSASQPGSVASGTPYTFL